MDNILNLSRENLEEWLLQNSIKPFRARQIFKWIYIRQADTFDEMTDISKDVRKILNRNFAIERLGFEKKETSVDGTEKFLFRLQDQEHIESVLIPEKDHFTLCISSQVGCAMGCKFCLTAKGGLKRNLSSWEIISQVRDIKHTLLQGKNNRILSNIVLMGMGEPLANYDAVINALKIITDTDFGLKFSPRRVTLSTAGVVPYIERLGRDTTVNLAISLNATEDRTRTRLMPINSKYPLQKLLQACQAYEMKPRDKITFEYILMEDINDTVADAMRLCKILAPIKAKVNLIPFNEHSGSPFKRPPREKISRFLQVLLDKNMTAIIRKSKGTDISAACGQLRAK